jgi:UDP-glucose 4-epimerase
MRILVTGGAGFIGSHVAALLLSAGHEVAIVDDLSTGHPENIPSGAHFYACDICDDRLESVFADFRPEVISHHAAQMSVRVSIQQPRHDAAVNVGGSVHLLECAIKAGTRKVIYASTGGAVYGEPRYLPCDEDHPVSPLCHYGISKHTVEHYLELYSHLYGLDYTVLRYPNVYGPRQDPEGEAGVVAIFARSMLRNLPVTIYGDGRQERDFVAVADVARATLAALDGGSRTIINIGSGTGTSVREIFNHLAGIIGYTRRPEFGPARLGEVYRIYLSGEHARDLLGWAPSVALGEGLAETVDWVRRQQALEERRLAQPAFASK